MVGGVATAAAVRTFPFRVFSFPKEIVRPTEVAIYRTAIEGPFQFVEILSLTEAKARYGYEWRPGYARTQQTEWDKTLYGSPRDMRTTGLI